MSPLRKENGGGLEIVQPIPKPDGKIFDARGDTVAPAHLPLMARLDNRATEKVELSRGTLWLLGTLLILGGVVFSYGSSIIGWARDDESQRVKMANVERQVEEMRGEVRELKQLLQEQRVKDAEARGYKLGTTDNQVSHPQQK